MLDTDFQPINDHWESLVLKDERANIMGNERATLCHFLFPHLSKTNSHSRLSKQNQTTFGDQISSLLNRVAAMHISLIGAALTLITHKPSRNYLCEQLKKTSQAGCSADHCQVGTVFIRMAGRR